MIQSNNLDKNEIQKLSLIHQSIEISIKLLGNIKKDAKEESKKLYLQNKII